jgi:hypothetical protein
MHTEELGWAVNNSGFVGYMVSITTTQLHHFDTKAATRAEWRWKECLCSNKTLFTKHVVVLCAALPDAGVTRCPTVQLSDTRQVASSLHSFSSTKIWSHWLE